MRRYSGLACMLLLAAAMLSLIAGGAKSHVPATPDEEHMAAMDRATGMDLPHCPMCPETDRTVQCSAGIPIIPSAHELAHPAASACHHLPRARHLAGLAIVPTAPPPRLFPVLTS